MPLITSHNSEHNKRQLQCLTLAVNAKDIFDLSPRPVFANGPNATSTNPDRKFVDFHALLQRLTDEKKLEENRIAPLLKIFQEASDAEKEAIFKAYISKGIGDGPKDGTPEKQKLNEIEAKLKSGTTPEAAKSPASPEKTPENNIKNVQEDIHKRVQDVLGELAVKIEAAKKDPEKNKKILQTLERLHRNLSTISKLTDASNKEITSILDKLKTNAIITDDQYNNFLAIDGGATDFKKEWRDLIDPLRGNPQVESQLKRVHDLKLQRARHVEDFKKAAQEIGQVLQEAAENIDLQAQQERSLRSWSTVIGFPLKEGQEVRIKRLRKIVKKDAQGNIIETSSEPVRSKVILQKVSFEDITFQDINGQTVTIPATIPTIEINYQDEVQEAPPGWELVDTPPHSAQGTEKTSADVFKKSIDAQQGTEIFEEDADASLPDDKARIAVEIERANQALKFNAAGEDRDILAQIEVGKVFEYREAVLPDENSKRQFLTGAPKSVTIKNISKETDHFFDDDDPLQKRISQKKGTTETIIELDTPVIIATYPNVVKRNKLTLGEFVRWCKRMNAVPPMTLEELRSALQKEKADRDAKYAAAGRNPEHYPPILAEEGEMLYYDTQPPKTFVIKRIKDDGKIFLDNGSYYTPATFLQWVKDNEVEKMTPESEAKKRTAHIKDSEEKKKAEALAAAQAKEEADARKDLGQTQPQQVDGSEAPSGASGSYLKQLWNQTYWLGGGSLYTMGEQIFEYIKNQLTRLEKERVGAVGEMALTPLSSQLGGVMKSLKQSGETEDVNRYVEVYKQYGPSDLYGRLAITTSKNELKAIFTVLAEKGAIRWEDPLLWDAMTRIAQQVDTTIVIDRFDEDLFRKVIDDVYGWGGQSYAGWKSQNNGAYNSTKSAWQDEARRIENDPQGLRGRLQALLHQHIQGEYVDPAIFEGYLHFAIDAGKLYFQDKVFFLIMGMGVEGPDRGGYRGLPLLTNRRMSELEAAFINRFPIVEYFVDNHDAVDENGNPILGPDGNPKKIPFNQNHAKDIIRRFIDKRGTEGLREITDPGKLTAGDVLIDFIEREMNLSERVRTRAGEKAAADFGNKDHDDLQYIAIFANEDQIDRVAVQGAGMAQATPAGVRNVLTGLNHYSMIYLDKFNNFVDSGNEEAADRSLKYFQSILSSFVRLHAILDSRFYHNNIEYRKWGPESFDKPGADTDPTRSALVHVREMDRFISKLIERLPTFGGNKEIFTKLQATWKILRTKHGLDEGPALVKQQQAGKDFGPLLGQAFAELKRDKSKKEIMDFFADISKENPILGIRAKRKGAKVEIGPEGGGEGAI